MIVNDYDIFQQAGTYNKATIVHHNINVTHKNGLIIELVGVKENPAISGIEVIPNNGNFNFSTLVPSTAPTAAPATITDPGQAVIRINAGGDEYIDSNGNKWSADKYVVNFYGQDYTDCFQRVTGTFDDTLYCCHHWFSVRLQYTRHDHRGI